MIGSVTLIRAVPIETYGDGDESLYEGVEWPLDIARRLVGDDATMEADCLSLIDYRDRQLRGAVVDLARTALRAGSRIAKMGAGQFVSLLPISTGYDGGEPVVRDAMAEWALSGRVTPTADLFDAARLSDYRVQSQYCFELRVQVEHGQLFAAFITILGKGNSQSANISGIIDELVGLVVPPVRRP